MYISIEKPPAPSGAGGLLTVMDQIDGTPFPNAQELPKEKIRGLIDRLRLSPSKTHPASQTGADCVYSRFHNLPVLFETDGRSVHALAGLA